MDFANPLGETRLIVSGKEVYLQDNQELIALLQTPGQAHFPFTVLDLGETVRLLRTRIPAA